MASTACTDPFSCIATGVGNAFNGISNTLSYWSDPWGNTYKALQSAANDLSSQLLPQLTSATLPDLTVDWFVAAYRVSFAVAIFGAVVLLLPQLVRTARGAQSGRELAGSLGLYFPLFLLGAMFGPEAGVLLVDFFHALSTSLSTWGITGSLSEVNDRFQAMISEQDPLAIAGGLPVAVLLMFLMLCGLFFVLLILLVQLVTLYFTGVLVPFALVWIIDPPKRRFGMRLVGIWVGILAAHPLLFFLLGFAFMMLGGSIDFLGNDASLQKLAQLLAAVIAMFLAAFSPLLLMRFAPIIPTGFGGTQGAGVTPGAWGPNSMGEALERYRKTPSSNDSTPAAPASGGGSGGASDAGAGAAGGPTAGGTGLGAVAASRAAGPGGGGGGAAGSAGAAEGTAAAGGTAGAAAAGGEAAVAAGAAESATGVGAVVGVPTLILAGAALAGSKALSAGQAAANQSLAAMDQGGGDA